MKRIISLLLAVLMLLSSMTLLFSCKEDEEGKKEGNTEIKTYDEESIFYERSLVSDDLPDVDYGGRKFRIAAYGKGEIFVEDEKRNQGDLILDAKFARNQAVENRFNVELELVYSGTYSEVDEYASKTILSGSDEFDLYYGMVMSAGGLTLKKLFLNWYDIEHIDFSKPWWYASNSDELTYNGKAPIAISHFNYSAVSGAYCLYFNKNLAASYELGDLYGLVLDGKWTFDKFHEMVKDIYIDDGNDKKDENDFYGMTQNQGTALNSYLWAFDNPIVAKDEEGIPQVAVKTDKIDSIVNSLYDFLYNTDGVFYDVDNLNEKTIAYNLFYSKRAIFMMGTVGSATNEKLRNFEDDYGLLPLPKFDENQSEYKTMVGGHHSAIAVPKTCKDTEFVGTIVEALSAESWKTVTPTLYEIALKTRYLRDSESKEIMDIIIEGTTFDYGSVYDNWKGFAFMLERMMAAGNSNFESYYNKQFKSARLHYKTIVKAMDKI